MVSILRDIQVFVTYAHEDELYRTRLGQHLKLFERKGTITCWHDRLITAGTNWAREIDKSLAESDVILALVSAAFLASDYCYDVELAAAIERHKFGRSRLIPIIVRPAAWHESPLGQLQALPIEAKPISTWGNEDEAWASVIEGILKVVGEVREQKKAFLNAMPTVFRDYFTKRAQLILGDDSEVTRNITRLKSKNNALWSKLEDYRRLAIAHTNTIEKKFGELYELTYSKTGQTIGFLMPTMLLELNEEHSTLLSTESKLISEVESAKLDPTFFGLPSLLENADDLVASGNVTVKLLGGIQDLTKSFNTNVLAPIREIGDKEQGEDFEKPKQRAQATTPRTMNTADENKQAFLDSVDNGDLINVKILLKSGIDPDTRDTEGFTPLMQSATWGHTDIALALIQAGADVNLKANENTALMTAAFRGNTDIVRLLIEAGADVNAVNRVSGMSALRYAQMSGEKEVIQALLESGATE